MNKKMKYSLFKVKPFDQLMREASGDSGGLKRALSATNLIFLGIGAIIGAGIFVLTGEVSATYAGPAIILSFIVAAMACAAAGLCYAELTSMIPISGSAYTYAYATLGELFAWMIGWLLIVEYLFAASTVSVGWSGYVVSFLGDIGTNGIHIPPALTNAPFLFNDVLSEFTTKPFLNANNVMVIPGIINLPAMFIVFLLTIILVVGVKESAKFNNIIVIIKVSVIIIFLVAGVWFISTANWHPFIPANTGKFGSFGISGILRGAAVIFFAYIGFDAVSTAAQESKNPQRDLPIGILGSLAICTVLYILVALVLTGVVSYTKLGVSDPIAVGVDAMNSNFARTILSPLIKIGAIAGLSSVVLVMLLGQPRIFMTMSKDGLLPPIFARIHSKFKTPYMSTIIVGLVAMVLAGLFPIGVLSKLVSLGTLLAFSSVCLAILILRKRQPDANRPFKTPFSPWIPLFGICSCMGVTLFLNIYAWITMLVWLAIGLVVYFTYGMKNSALNKATNG
jgi:APA family basic amino acid/polyamine antiporter